MELEDTIYTIYEGFPLTYRVKTSRVWSASGTLRVESPISSLNARASHEEHPEQVIHMRNLGHLFVSSARWAHDVIFDNANAQGMNRGHM